MKTLSSNTKKINKPKPNQVKFYILLFKNLLVSLTKDNKAHKNHTLL